MNPNDFNPRSPDAMFATILQRLQSQDDEAAKWRSDFSKLLNATKEGVDKTNGRVTALEKDKWFQRGFVAAISVVSTAAWQWWTGHK